MSRLSEVKNVHSIPNDSQIIRDEDNETFAGLRTTGGYHHLDKHREDAVADFSRSVRFWQPADYTQQIEYKTRRWMSVKPTHIKWSLGVAAHWYLKTCWRKYY